MIKIILDFKFTNIRLDTERVVIYDRDGEYYFINDLDDKYDEVIRMPHYIKDDYLKYTSQILTTHIFNKLMMKIIKSPSEKMRNLTTEEYDIITQIKRELKLKEIL